MKKYILSILFIIALLTSGCLHSQSIDVGGTPFDNHSYAEPEKAIVKHLDLQLAVNFNEKKLSGVAIWSIDNVSKGNEIIFDNNGLNIQKITLGEDEVETNYSFGAADSLLGSAIHIAIKPETRKVNIYYSTKPDAIALQWLTPEQTTDKKSPYLFTQSYSIWARSWLPCQDAPGIRFTYNATIKAPKQLMAAMSAEGPRKKQKDGIYNFKQINPIPAYLTALVIGDIQFKAIDYRTGIYAEPSMIDKAAWEFADMGKMVNVAESLYGPYRWGRFDVVVAPPSFTFSGMENPNLVLLNTALVAGDRSLIGTVVHELAHFWSGNLVTNASWNDFWLNEGITTYVTNRIQELLYGVEVAEMETVLSRTQLYNAIERLGEDNPDTHLYLDLKGRNPDEALTAIPYKKGFAFLQTIENIVGRQRFDAFLKNYFDTHTFQSHTTEQFLSALREELIQNDTSLEKRLQLNDWVYKGKIPDNLPVVTSSIFHAIDSIALQAKETGVYTALAKKITTTNEKLYFINQLPTDITKEEMLAIDKEFDFTNSENFKIAGSWLTLSIKNRYNEKSKQLENYMLKYGSYSKNKYLELAKTEEGKNWARQVFKKAKAGYHPLTTAWVQNVLYN
jgi:aminopeptidase N